MQEAFRDPAVRFRLMLTAVLVAYIAAILATSVIQLSPVLDVPLAVIGWLFLAGLLVWATWRRRIYAPPEMLRSLLDPWPLAAVFVSLVLIASYFAIAWRLPSICHGVSLNCFKGYDWGVHAGLYYHVTPNGLREQISRSEYVQEVGVHVRSAAAFGVYSLVLAWAGAAVLTSATTRRSSWPRRR